MTRLRGHFQGFKLGARLPEEAMGLFELDSKLGEATRHALKNIATSSLLETQSEVFSIGGVFHAPGGKQC